MAILTKKQREEYLKRGGVRCPFCVGKNITAQNYGGDGFSTWCDVGCDDCGEKWTDCLKLVDVHEQDRDEEEG